MLDYGVHIGFGNAFLIPLQRYRHMRLSATNALTEKQSTLHGAQA
jgi:hypothetical protein